MSLLELNLDLHILIINACPNGMRYVLSRTCQFFRKICQSFDFVSYQEFVKFAARQGYLDLLDSDLVEKPKDVRGIINKNAARGGHIEILQWLVKRDIFNKNNICTSAAKTGQIHVIEWARSNVLNCKWNSETCNAAAKGGHINTIIWLMSNGCNFYTYGICTMAAKKGHLNILDAWSEYCDNGIFRLAILHGHFHILEWGDANKYIFINHTFLIVIFKEAIRLNNLEIVKWCIEKGFKDKKSWISHMAAHYNHFGMLKWLVQENGYKLNCAISYESACNGNLEMLKWARKHGCAWGIAVCTEAAKNGHLQILKWARKHKCPWNEDICKIASKNGHIHVLKWAHENDCAWDKWVTTYAIMQSRFKILKWAIRNGCDIDEDVCINTAINAARKQKSDRSEQVLAWLLSKKYPCSQPTLNNLISKFSHNDTIQLLVATKYLNTNDNDIDDDIDDDDIDDYDDLDDLDDDDEDNDVDNNEESINSDDIIMQIYQ